MINKIRNNKVFKIIFKTLQTITFIIIFIYAVLILFQRFSNNSDIFGYRMFTVATKSMVPVYKVSDVILIKKTPLEELNVKDDITYLGNKDDFNGKIVTHRIVQIDKAQNRILTKGTAATVEDPEITYQQVYGKVIAKLTFITFVSQLIRNQYGFFFLVFLPIVLILFVEVVDFVNNVRDKKIEKIANKKKKEEDKDEDEEII